MAFQKWKSPRSCRGFGAKRTLAPRIIDEIGDHSAYWEPFCGSMAVLLVKAPCAMEVANDLHGDLINLALVVKHPILGAALYRRLRRVIMHEKLFEQEAEVVRSYNLQPAGADPDVDRAFAFFVCSWMGRNGVSGTKKYNQGFCKRFTSNGGHGAKRFFSAVASIPAWRWRMRGVQIYSMGALEMIAQIEDKAGTVIYCDPPYLKKGAAYVHDFEPVQSIVRSARDMSAAALEAGASEELIIPAGQKSQHITLAELLQRFRKTKVVVSYYDDPILDALYPRSSWTKISVPVRKSLAQGLKAQGESNEAVAPEVLLVNRPSSSMELF